MTLDELSSQEAEIDQEVTRMRTEPGLEDERKQHALDAGIASRMMVQFSK